MDYSHLFYLFLLIQIDPNYSYKYDDKFTIMGGDPIRIEEAPFMAIFKRRDQEYGCGGTIVHKRFVVSAAHCDQNDLSNMVIVVGTDRVQGGQYYDIMASYPHPKFQRDYDVVVLKLAKDLLFSSKVQPIQMAERGMDINDGAVLRVMGFGMTDPNDRSSASPILLKVDVPYMNTEKCSRFFPNTLTERMICAGESGRGACYGDSGGPLIYNNRHVGIVSFGTPDCAASGSPAVFARVSALRDFIDKVMSN